MIHLCVKLRNSQHEACQNNQASFINKLMDVTPTEFENIPHSTHFFDLAFTVKDFQ